MNTVQITYVRCQFISNILYVCVGNSLPEMSLYRVVYRGTHKSQHRDVCEQSELLVMISIF